MPRPADNNELVELYDMRSISGHQFDWGCYLSRRRLITLRTSYARLIYLLHKCTRSAFNDGVFVRQDPRYHGNRSFLS